LKQLPDRGKKTKMDELYEAIEPEPTDEEIEADYLDHLIQTAPPIVWECYCESNNECHVCREDDSRYCGPSPCVS
jgi:hypothetical protein